MISEDDALRHILADAVSLPARRVPLVQALNRFATDGCVARVPLPNFDNSAMDGYAVVASDCRPGARLTVTGEQPAGPDRGLQLSSGNAIRIFTGAPMPVGADAVVMQEDVQANGTEIVVNADVHSGEFVRRRGCDVALGQKILSKGDRVRGVTLGVLAAQGVAEVAVGGETKVSILSTGSELVEPGNALEPGQIYDSNSSLLRALVTSCGATTASVERCPDEREPLLAALRRAAASNIMLISGGVSVGQHDLVKSVLADIGAKLDIWRVAIKPGKPFLFGRIGECRVFGLPGNPVSTFITFLKFVRPAALKMMGAGEAELPLRRVTARLTEAVGGDGNRPHYIRGWLAEGNFRPIGRQESHAIFGLSRSNALLRVESGAAFQAGDLVEVEIWD
jgi:molybdopterin molybdotransferase